MRRVAVAFTSALLALLAAEGGHRLWLSIDGRPYRRWDFERELVRADDATAAFVPGGVERKKKREGGKAGDFSLLHPYYGSEDHHDTGDVLAYFRAGVPEDEYAIVVLGGSVAAAWSADVDGSFAATLEADPRFAGRRVRLLSYAHAAYKQPQQATRLLYLLSFGYRPDAVINLDGFNELAMGATNARVGTNPLYPATVVWGAVLRDRKDMSVGTLDALIELRRARNDVAAFVDLVLRWRLSVSSLAAALVERRLNTLDAQSAEATKRFVELHGADSTGSQAAPASVQRQMHGPPFEAGEASVLEMSAESWFQGSLDLRALCAERGIPYLHCLQPSLLDPGSKVASREEQLLGDSDPSWKPAIVGGYPLLRERGLELVRRGVWFEDLTRVFTDVSETLYADPCHVFGPGHAILAREMAERFLGHLSDAEAAGAPR